MKRKQRAIKDFDFSKYDFSDCVEITGDALYLINGGGTTTESKSDSGSSQGSGKNDSSGNAGGGHEIANSHEAVANAKPGDYFYRDDGSKQVVNNADIKYEQNYLQNSGNNDNSSQTPEITEPTDAGSQSKTTGSFSSGSSSSSDHKEQTSIKNNGFNHPTEYSSDNKLSTNDVSNVSNKNNYSKYQEMMRARVTNAEAMELSQRAEKAAEEGKDFNANAEISQMRGESSEGNAAATGKPAANSMSKQGNDGYPDYVDTVAKTVRADINSVESIEKAHAAYYVLQDQGYTFTLTDGSKDIHTFSDPKYESSYYYERFPATINNTFESVAHYYNQLNMHKTVNIGDKVFEDVKRKNNKRFENRIKSGLTDKASGNYGINMASLGNILNWHRDYFVGHTNIDYEITTGEETSTVKFTAFRDDGFWDVIDIGLKPDDGPGPNRELRGSVYPFFTRSWTETFDNPPVMNWLKESGNDRN